MSTHNICFHEKIRKIFTRYPILSEGILFLTKPEFLCSYVCIHAWLLINSGTEILSPNLLTPLLCMGNEYNLRV